MDSETGNLGLSSINTFLMELVLGIQGFSTSRLDHLPHMASKITHNLLQSRERGRIREGSDVGGSYEPAQNPCPHLTGRWTCSPDILRMELDVPSCGTIALDVRVGGLI